MRDAAPRRSLFAIAVIAAVALVCLLLGQRAVEGYLEEQKARHPPAPDALHGGAGASGLVTYADASPAAGARVRVVWRDGAGRPGSTPAIADASGHFVQSNVPPGATIVEVRASIGPLLAKAVLSDAGAETKSAGNLRLVLPDEFTLAGLVRRADDRAPVSGASLDAAGIRTQSGASGDFQIAHVPASLLRVDRPVLRIEAEGLAVREWPVPRDDMPESYGDLTILMEPLR
jgi:hypothetical protein